MNQSIATTLQSMPYLAPEWIITGTFMLTLIVGLVDSTRTNLLISISLLGYGLAFFITILHWPNSPTPLFGGMLRADDFGACFKLLFLIGGVLAILISPGKKHPTEYLILILAIVLGSMFLVMSMNLVMVLLALELISLSSYLLAGFAFDRKSAEGSLKYFLIGTVATAVMVYGLSLIYGVTGTLDFSSTHFADEWIAANTHMPLIGAIMILAAGLFKVTAVPLHLWAPDVYESAPTSVVAFLSVVPKLAGIGLLIRLVLAFNLFGQSGYPWPEIIAVISIASILVGTFSALTQTNVKRMMAYSSIAQAGFLLMGLTSISPEGVHMILFYCTVFLLMNYLVFTILYQFEEQANVHIIPAFAGLGKSAWPVGVALLIGFIALTGLPPTAGFTAKLFMFSTVWVRYEETQSVILLALFIIALISTVISLFFYLKIPYFLFIREAPSAGSIKISKSGNLLTLILVIGLIFLFLYPGVLMRWINQITFVL